MSAYKVEIVKNGESYKPVLENGYYNNYWITKFLVLENSASDIKLWTNTMDVDDDTVAIEIPKSGLVAGNEYDIALGKLSWSGTLKVLAYQTPIMPLDFPISK